MSDNKDFFDEEYDRIESSKPSKQDEQFQNWSGQAPEQSVQPRENKPLYIILICVALVLCIVLGWVLCAVFGGGFQSSEQRLLDEVFSVLDNEYYKKVDDVKMWEGVEKAGTALLQNAGDRFSMLMSPSTYYNYLNPQSVINSNGIFGMSSQIVEGLGLYVTSVKINSNAYGVLQEEDLIVKMTDLNDGAGVDVDGVHYVTVELNKLSSKVIEKILDKTNSANFSVLRSGEVFVKYMERGVVEYVNEMYPFEFVEFYFGDGYTNVSLSHTDHGPQISTKEARLLNRLSEIPDTGYIRIDQFMDTYTETGKTTASQEFLTAMTLFKARGLKHLILDLKGNPGGSVQYVTEIAGMLATDSKLSPSLQSKVRNKNGELLITTLTSRTMGSWNYSATSSYNTYFGAISERPKIVIWTDGGSASASELLTGALTDYGTAVQMGTRTYGKGIAQTVKELEQYTGTFVVDGQSVTSCWAVYYTVAEYFSPVTNTNIHGTGYTPAKEYDNLDTYDKLWTATAEYFRSNSGGGVLAAA